MNNILTYIKYRGDLDMKTYPFNEVDALILSELSYIRFENIVPTTSDGGKISIAEASEKYIKSQKEELIFYKRAEELLDVMAHSKRYANLKLSNYVSSTSKENNKQFSALHIDINAFLTFVAFRGTDETLVGWREDCNMSYMMPVPAQTSAVEYINGTAKKVLRKYIIGGHSKGGNLAIYSSVYCKPNIQKKIKLVYSFDGPGFNKTMIEEPAYKQIKPYIMAYVPESSVIGMLMEHEEIYSVVKSSETAFMQHDAFSWSIDGERFELIDSTDDFSNSMSQVLRGWLTQVDHKERKILVDTVFDILETAGIKTVMDFEKINVQMASSMIKSVASLPREQRETVGKLIKILIEESKKIK